MYIPFPRKIDYAYAGGAAALLGTVLLVEGNPLQLCAIVAAQLMVTVFAFNLAGGLHSPVGSYVLFVTLFTGELGTIVKAVLNEPLLENVPNADKTLVIYLLGTCAMTVAVWLSQQFLPKKPFLAGRLTQENTNQVVAGCFVLGVGLPLVLDSFSEGGNGSVSGVLHQLNEAAPLAILIAVYQRVKRTGGRSSFSWLALCIWIYFMCAGFLSYSKEQLFYPTFAWIIAAAAARLRVTMPQILITGACLTLGALFLVPYSQYGRNFRDQGTEITFEMLRHPIETREKALAAEGEVNSDPVHWYRKPEGIFDRLTLVPIDGALIEKTDQTGRLGLRNIFLYFENIVPHFLIADKPNIGTGNQYAHEIGLLSDEDTSTGVSFSPYGEAYHLLGWTGVLVVMPALQFLLFVVVQWAAGTIDQAPWALFYIAAFGHSAAEGSLITPVYMLSYGTEALIVTALSMIYLAPIVGTLIVGPEKRRTAGQRQRVQVSQV